MLALKTKTALEYVSLGYCPVPIVLGTKSAAVRWKSWQKTVPPTQTIIDCFAREDRDVALLTGNGVIVIDVDDPALVQAVIAQAGDTPMQCRTPRGGAHLYYAVADGVRYGNAVRINGSPIDIRADGAYAMCPWSRDERGVWYEWLAGPVEKSRLPLLQGAWIQKREPSRRVLPAVTLGSPRRALRRARAYVRTIEGAISGMGGHSKTFRVACVLAVKFGLSFEDAWPLLCEWNEQCEPPWSERELLHKLEDALKQRGR